MPAIPLIGPLIGAGTGILSSIFGNNAQQNAVQQLIAGANQAGQGVTQAVQQGQAQEGGNVANAQSWIGGAAGQAQQGVGTAVSNANQQIGTNAGSILGMTDPYQEAGVAALPQIQAIEQGQLGKQFSFNPSDLQSDPGYQFTLQQGQQAIQRAAAAQGGLFSTGTQKSLAGYTTGTANQYFNDAFNRSLSTFNTNRQGALSQINTLQGLAGQGLQATNLGANALQTAGLAQGTNALQGAQYQGNTGLTAAQLAGNWGLQGSQFGANLGFQGAQQKGNWIQQASTAGALGSLAQGTQNSSITSILGGLFSNPTVLNALGLGGGVSQPSSPPSTAPTYPSGGIAIPGFP